MTTPKYLQPSSEFVPKNCAYKQALDYYPYGAQRINTGMDASDRRFIGQFGDDATSLDYLNARYYDPARGQFTSQDPVHLALGNAAQVRELAKQEQGNYLSDPQLLNSYGYARGNPIGLKDPEGLTTLMDVYNGRGTMNDYYADVGAGAMILSQGSPTWNFALDHPWKTGLLGVGPLSGVAAASGIAGASALGMATYQGVGATFAAQQGFATLYYSALTVGTLSEIPSTVRTLSQVNFRNPSTIMPAALSLTLQVGPNLIGGYTGAIGDIYQFLQTLDKGLTDLRNTQKKNQSDTQKAKAPTPPKKTKTKAL